MEVNYFYKLIIINRDPDYMLNLFKKVTQRTQRSHHSMQHEIVKLREKIEWLEGLIQVTAIISSVLDLDELLNLVMDKAQSVMHAEASSILLINEITGMLECEVALGEVGEQVKQKVRLEIGQGIGGWVAKTGKPVIVPDVSAEARFDADTDQSTGFKTRSILASPLKVKEKVIGVAEVLNPINRKCFSDEDLDLFITFCQQVALAIENAKMHRHLLDKQKLEQQLEAAYIIQQSFMPQNFPESADNLFSIYAKNLPAKSIGGDFYDFIEFNDEKQIGIIIGDVSGKGIPAALYMARLVSDFRFYSLTKRNNTATCLEAINNSLVSRSRRGMFVTAQYLLADQISGKITYSNCGHLPFLWYHQASQTVEWVKNTDDIPLGIQKGIQFSSNALQLAHGDYIILFTDGIIEAKNDKKHQFQMKRLIETLNEGWNRPENLVNHVLKAIDKFCKGMPQHDDITIVAYRWH